MDSLTTDTLEEHETKDKGRTPEDPLARRARLVQTLKEESMSAITLQPGDFGVQAFTLCTQNWLFFQPAGYELPIHIDFKIDQATHRETVKYKLGIRSPFRAIMCGAALGAIAGFVLNDISANQQGKLVTILNWPVPVPTLLIFLLSLVGSGLAAMLTVIAFARKRDAQPFISVEDFWGGVFVGAVVGYGGKSVFNNLLQPSNHNLH